MDLSIVVVNYNTKELLRRCLESVVSGQWLVIGEKKRPPVTSHQPPVAEIIVVDNGSEDGSEKIVISDQRIVFSKKEKIKLPITDHRSPITVRLIKNRTNLGFAKANNQALRQAQGEYILLLNSDTEVESGCLERLIEFAKKHPEAGVVGPRLLDPNGSTQPSVYHFPTILRAVKEYWLGQGGAYEKYAPKDKKPVEVDAVVGAAMLVPKKVFDKVGPLDERYFMYFEDLDFCRRVKKAGLKIYFLPQVEIIHHHGASGKEIPRETQKWLIESSKIYHGALKHYLINFIIWSSQKWQKLLKKIKI